MSDEPVIDEDLARRLAASAESLPGYLADPEAAMSVWRQTSSGPVPPWWRRHTPIRMGSRAWAAVRRLRLQLALWACDRALRRAESSIHDEKVHLLQHSVRLQSARVRRDALEHRWNLLRRRLYR